MNNFKNGKHRFVYQTMVISEIPYLKKFCRNPTNGCRGIELQIEMVILGQTSLYITMETALKKETTATDSPSSTHFCDIICFRK